MLKLIIRYFLLYFGILLIILTAIGWFMYNLAKELPPVSEVINYKLAAGSEVYDSNGRLIHIYAFEHRKLVELRDIPAYFIEMLIQVEDSNFYSHWGVDVLGLIRAAYVNLKRGKLTQGASTISQQLARNMFLSTEKVWSRKIKEMMLAMMIEMQFTKQEILESYLNKVLFGNGYYGIEMASMNYFLKSCSEISIAESALLIGLLRGSGYYNPLKHPERAISRRNLVLDIALDNKLISPSQHEEAVNSELVINRINVNSSPKSDYFIEYIRPVLERKYGTNTLFTGGLKIYTTIDYDLQIYADSVMNRVLSDFEKSRRYRVKFEDIALDAVNIKTDYIQGGVFGFDPHTGHVKIMIGGRSFQHSKFNRVMQAKRQAGSTFKPFVYAAAIANGFTAATVITDEPLIFMQRDEVFWEPRNYTLDFRGPMRLREALQRSTNIVAAKVIYDIGPEKVVSITNKMNFSTRIYPYYSLSVGSCDVIPYEMIKAFSIFPGRGDMVEPVFVTRVTDSRGKVLEQAPISKKNIIDPKVAFIVNDMMKSVLNEGTAISARYQGFKMPAGGKTGTTDDYRDAWFVGYTKNLVLGTWAGFDDNRTLGSSMTGGVAALPIWIPIMKYYEERLRKAGINVMEDFDMPQGIVRLPVSRRTGLLPSDDWEPTILESFIEYTQPKMRSDLFNYNYFQDTHFITEFDHIIDVR